MTFNEQGYFEVMNPTVVSESAPQILLRRCLLSPQKLMIIAV